MQVADNHVIVLVEEAKRPEDLDASSLKDRLQEAERALEDAEDDSERQRAAQRDKRRLEKFIEIAEGSR
jgi:F0F1-type ATP synthase epsilon subunit